MRLFCFFCQPLTEAGVLSFWNAIHLSGISGTVTSHAACRQPELLRHNCENLVTAAMFTCNGPVLDTSAALNVAASIVSGSH